jgi:hypothetical protein
VVEKKIVSNDKPTKQQFPVYFMSEALIESKRFYSEIKKICYAVIISAHKLRHYFKVHIIKMLTNQPLHSFPVFGVQNFSYLPNVAHVGLTASAWRCRPRTSATFAHSPPDLLSREAGARSQGKYVECPALLASRVASTFLSPEYIWCLTLFLSVRPAARMPADDWQCGRARRGERELGGGKRGEPERVAAWNRGSWPRRAWRGYMGNRGCCFRYDDAGKARLTF